jgi:hypothetical protein
MRNTSERLEKIATDLDRLHNEAHDMRHEKLAFMIALAMQEADRTMEEEAAELEQLPLPVA